MKVGPSFDPHSYQPDEVQKVVRLERWSIVWLGSIILVMALTMGSSQAMKTAFVEDLLSLVPPIALLCAIRYRRRGPSQSFPYGRRSAPDLAFLAASLALLALGAMLLIESLVTLFRREHPTFGSVLILGRPIWSGWLMMAALAYSAVPPVVLGRLKKRPASALHERALCADADMNAADWQTALAGIAGIIGIGLGLWWADAVAAALIALSITFDGLKNMRRVLQTLMHHSPMKLDEPSPDPLVARLHDELRMLPWVRDVGVRIREEGEVLCGEIYVVPHAAEVDVKACEEAAECARKLHWRFHDLVVVPVSSMADGDEG